MEELNQIGIEATSAPIWAQKTRYRVALGPFQLVYLRLRGVQIVNVHFVQEMFRPLTANSSLWRSIFYVWYRCFLWIASTIGIRLVWTAHNLLPHERVFTDDRKARQVLVNKCDLVISTNPVALTKLEEEFAPRHLMLINPSIKTLQPNITKSEARKILGIAGDKVLFSHLGRMREHKGTRLFLDAIDKEYFGGAIRVVGPKPQDSQKYITELETKMNALKDQEVDIEFDLRFISDEEFANICVASDFLVYPLESKTNSGVISQALTLGLPLIIPDYPELDWIPTDCVIRFSHVGGAQALREVMDQAIAMSEDERLTIAVAGREFTKNWNWPTIAQNYKSAYEGILEKQTSL